MLLGQAHYRGAGRCCRGRPRVAVRRFPQRGENVVYHEFAHQLDMIDGITDGTPPLGDDEEARERWVRVCTAAYDTVRADRSEVLRPYAGTNPAEFFAVATEVFFNRPDALQAHEPDLYAELLGLLRPGSGGAPRAPVPGLLRRWHSGGARGVAVRRSRGRCGSCRRRTRRRRSRRRCDRRSPA